MTLIRPKSLRDLALEHIRSQIVDGTFQMGQPLSERRISEQLAVSKSPVREALAQLREEGLITIEPQKGARVFTLSEDEVDQICDFRLIIEGAVFNLALERDPDGLADAMDAIVKDMERAQATRNIRDYLALDTKFHQTIFKHAQNTYLSASYERFVGKIAALRTHLSRMPSHTTLSFNEHGELAEEARRRNQGQIRIQLKAHINRTRDSYKASLALLPQF